MEELLKSSGNLQRFKIGIDIGGTFTDVVLLNERTGETTTGKLLSTPKDLSEGVSAIFKRILEETGIDPRGIVAAIHGTTVATNAIIERKGAKTALLTTKGFRDVLEIGREIRYDLYDLFLEMPEPLVPRYLRREVSERLDKNGNILIEIDPEEPAEVLSGLESEGVDAVAVCFLHSYANPVHEQKVAEIIRSRHPGVLVSISSDVASEVREYERTSTTVVNAYLQPLVEGYLDKLEESLKRIGYQGRMFIMMSNGGISTSDTAKKFPVRMIESGPAAGAMAAAFFGKFTGENDILSFDMGGTTAKMCVIHKGKPILTNEFEAARVHRFAKGSGLPLKIPSIELIEIGTGGGSIASIDAMGLLKVGPDSSGADPGPACYNLGGQNSTITDADLVLGFLDEDYFLGGEMKLDKAASIDAIMPLSKKLKMEPMEIAAGIVEVANENMAIATRIHIAELGMDPRKFSMIAFGGAGPVHAVQVARKIGLKRVIVPLGAGTLSALGILVAPPAIDFAKAYVTKINEIDWDRLNAIYRDMEDRGGSVLADAGVLEKDMVFERKADMRYIGQGYEISVPIPGGMLGPEDLNSIEDAFWREYQRLYGRHLENVALECVTWRMWANGKPPEVNMENGKGLKEKIGQSSLKGTRNVYFPEKKASFETKIYNRYQLRHGDAFVGPVIFEEKESTVVAGPDTSVKVDAYGNLVIELL